MLRERVAESSSRLMEVRCTYFKIRCSRAASVVMETTKTKLKKTHTSTIMQGINSLALKFAFHLGTELIISNRVQCLLF